MLTVVNGFRKTCIWPVDRHVFFDRDFAAAAPTNIELVEDVASRAAGDGEAPQAFQQTDRDTVPHAALPVGVAEAPRDTVLSGTGVDVAQVPGCGSFAPNAAHNMLAPADANTDMATNVDVNGAETQQHTAVHITTTAVSPIPKVAGHTARKCHGRGNTCIITLSSYKR